MKFSRICSSVFLIIGLAALGYADEHFPFLAEVSKKSVNVRAGANANFERIDQFNQGAQVVVVGKSFDWYKVQLSATTKAFIRADYLKVSSNSMAELIGDQVNMRALPNSESSSLGIIKKGDVVKVITQTNNWWQIEPPLQAVGWIREDFLRVKSLNIDTALIKKPLRLEALIKEQSLATVTVKGQLVLLKEPKADMRYELVVDGKTQYYVQGASNVDRFKGATVLIKGLVINDDHHQYSYPVLRAISISLLL